MIGAVTQNFAVTGKRETGARPVRTRHCMQGAENETCH